MKGGVGSIGSPVPKSKTTLPAALSFAFSASMRTIGYSSSFSRTGFVCTAHLTGADASTRAACRGRVLHDDGMRSIAHLDAGAQGTSRLVHDDRDRFGLLSRIASAFGRAL